MLANPARPAALVAMLGVLAVPARTDAADVVVAQHALGYVASQTAPAGTALPDGLVVPAGFRLAGSAVATGSHRWSADLLLTGPPTRALRSLVRVVRRVAPRGSLRCGTMPLGWVYASAPPAGLTDRDLRFTECTIEATGRTISVAATVDYGNSSLGPTGGVPPPPVPVAAAVLDVSAADGHRAPRLPTAPDVAARDAYPSEVPATGSVAGRGFVTNPIRLLPGSAAVSAPMAGMAAMHLALRVTARPARVFAAYVRELSARARTRAVHVRHGRSALGRWRTARIDSGGDDGNARLAMTTRCGRAYVDVWVD